MKKIGIFGGSFNPVHQGHYAIVRQILQNRQVDEIIVTPAFQNPLKQNQPQLEANLRLKMLEACFDEMPNVQVSDFELKAQTTSYTLYTLEHFHQLYPDAELYLILGEDAFHLFENWKAPQRILEIAKLLVFHRKGEYQGVKYNAGLVPADRLHWIEMSLPKISSTEIRNLQFGDLSQSSLIPLPALKVWQEYNLNNK